MKLYCALVLIFNGCMLNAMEVGIIQHIKPESENQEYNFNLMELYTAPCICKHKLKPSTHCQEYLFDTDGFSELSDASIEVLLKNAVTHHAGKQPWWFHKQLFEPLIKIIDNKSILFRIGIIKNLSIILRDALMYNDEPFARTLCAIGAYPNHEVSDPSCIDGEIATIPVFLFAKTLSLLNLCVENEANFELYNGKSKETILHKIIGNRFIPLEKRNEIVIYCIKHGADVNALNNQQKSATDIAAYYKDYKIVDTLFRFNQYKKEENKAQHINDDSQNESDKHMSNDDKPIETPKATATSSWWPWRLIVDK